MADTHEASKRPSTPSHTSSIPLLPLPSSSSSSSSVYEHRHALYYSYLFAALGDRMWEFASVVYLMALFPSTLLFSSVFGLCELLAGILAGPFIGRAIDSPTTSRLSIVRLSIVGQNVSIAAASTVLFLLLRALPTLSSSFLYLGYGALTATAMLAKASSSLNKVAIHKDWLVLLGEGRSERLSSLNAAMRGIDLSCSVVGPLLVGLGEVVIGKEWMVVVVGVWAAVSVVIELALVDGVWRQIPQLRVKQGRTQRTRDPVTPLSAAGERRSDEGLGAALLPVEDAANGAAGAHAAEPSPPRALPRLWWSSVSQYVTHPVFVPSLCYCLLYLSMLSFGGMMTAYLSSEAVALSPALLAAPSPPWWECCQL